MLCNRQVMNRVLAGAAVVLLSSAGSAQAQPGTVQSHQKISSTQGNGPPLDDGDFFGHAVVSLGDLDGDDPSVLALAVGAAGCSGGHGSNDGDRRNRVGTGIQ